MIKVNLVPADILAKARSRQMLLQAALAGGVLALILVLASFFHWYGKHRLENDYAYDQAEFKRLSVIVAEVDDLEKAAAGVRARLGVITDLLKGRAFYPIFMSEFARTVPAGVKVTQLSTASQSSNSVKLTMTALANTQDDIATWMRNLEKSSHFTPPELGTVSAGGAKQYSFTLTTSYTIKL